MIEPTVFIVLLVYVNGCCALLTSIGIRMGYHPYRKMVVAPIWPALAIERVDQWAKYDPENPPNCMKGYIKMVDDRVGTND